VAVRHPFLSSAASIALLALAAGAASAEPLQEALAHAYRTNPTLAAQRADLGALSEDVAEARAPGMPRVSVVASHSETVRKAIPSTLVPDRTFRSDLVVSVPLYRGGAVKFATLDARRRYEAGWENVGASTAELLVAVVVGYCDVLRDEAVVRLSERDVIVLEANLRAARGRFKIGDLTVTDVAQSEARYELAQGSLRAARARLIGSREEYLRIVGSPAVDLVPPPPLDGMPDSAESAVEIALQSNHALRASRLAVAASEYRIRSAEGERQPRLTVSGGAGHYDYLDSVSSPYGFKPNMRGTSAQVGLTLEVPLYQGGLPASHIRRARDERASAMEQEMAAERGVIAQVRAAYAHWRLISESEENAAAALAANERAVKGAKAENEVGTRTLVDVLDAERELLNSQINLLSVRRDAYVAQFALLAAMGQADPEEMGLVPASGKVAGPPRPRMALSDWADGKAGYRPVGTSTLEAPASNGSIE
jgi:outer membrane protein